jgi:hypothetical protein
VLRRAGDGTCELAGEGGLRRIALAQLEALQAADIVSLAGHKAELTEAGRARLARLQAPEERFLAQHGGVGRRRSAEGDARVSHLVHEGESPLAWFARRKGRDGRALIDAAQFAAGERLRTDFTLAGLSPRVTANWIAPVSQGRRSAGASAFADTRIAAKQRVTRALAAAGTEFSGFLLDVCCFLKGLETVECERGWPPRSARVVLGLGLNRLARHYGISAEARGPRRARTRAWQAEGARPVIDAT